MEEIKNRALAQIDLKVSSGHRQTVGSNKSSTHLRHTDNDKSCDGGAQEGQIVSK